MDMLFVCGNFSIKHQVQASHYAVKFEISHRIPVLSLSFFFQFGLLTILKLQKSQSLSIWKTFCLELPTVKPVQMV